MKNEHYNYRRWRRLAPAGLGAVGFGASLLGYAIEKKVEGAAPSVWFAWGTVSLVVLNSGLAMFGEAVKHRVLFDLQEEA